VVGPSSSSSSSSSNLYLKCDKRTCNTIHVFIFSLSFFIFFLLYLVYDFIINIIQKRYTGEVIGIARKPIF